MILRLNLGSGCRTIKDGGWIRIDWNPDCKPDIVHDLNEGLPMYDDESVDKILARGVLMALNNPVFQLREWWRVLKDHGELELRLPLVDISLVAACNDPDHKHLWASRTLEYFLSPGASWYGFNRGWYQRLKPPETDNEHRVEVWRKMKL